MVALTFCPHGWACDAPVVRGWLTVGTVLPGGPGFPGVPGCHFPPLLYETREQGGSVMGFRFSLGNRAKCVSLPSCFLKDASLLPNSSEPGPHTARTKGLDGPAAVLGTARCPQHFTEVSSFCAGWPGAGAAAGPRS